MPKYIVKTINDRNLVIEAEKYNFNANKNAYEFFAKDRDGLGLVPAATVLVSPEILAIVEESSEKDDYYAACDVNAEEDEDEDEVCLDCRFAELLESEEFFSRVFDIVSDWHGPDPSDEEIYGFCAPTEPEPLAKIEVRNYCGTPVRGIVAEDRFIPFGDGDWAADMMERVVREYVPGEYKAWVSRPLSDCPPVESV